MGNYTKDRIEGLRKLTKQYTLESRITAELSLALDEIEGLDAKLAQHTEAHYHPACCYEQDLDTLCLGNEKATFHTDKARSIHDCWQATRKRAEEAKKFQVDVAKALHISNPVPPASSLIIMVAEDAWANTAYVTRPGPSSSRPRRPSP